MTRDPFKLPDGPSAIQLSGGRTSAYMLWRILQAHGGTLPDDAHVLFQNTGRERDETLDFVQAIGQHWGVKITWLQYTSEKPHFEVVGHNSAARNGEPFEAIVRQRRYLPNVVTRFCTEVLKVRVARRYLIAQGYRSWTVAIGFRADEPGRVKKMHTRKLSREMPFMPLADAEITKRDVRDFWRGQPFDLELSDANGKTPEGNCDGCFLKSEKILASLARMHPDRAKWWADLEKEMHGKTFHKERSWDDLIKSVKAQPDFAFSEKSDVFCSTPYGSCFGD